MILKKQFVNQNTITIQGLGHLVAGIYIVEIPGKHFQTYIKTLKIN